MTLSLWIKVKESQIQSEELIYESDSEGWRQARNSVEMAKTTEQKADLKWFWRHMVVTTILTTETKKNKEKANNSLSYHCAPIQKTAKTEVK